MLVSIRIKSILFRTTMLCWLIIVLTLGIFLLLVFPYQKKALLDSMISKASAISSSIAQVTTSAVVNEEYSEVIRHCLKVIEENPSIIYVVITKKDGFSLVHKAKTWKAEQLSGIWNHSIHVPPEGMFMKNDLTGERVFHFSYPFSYSGIDWGWINIGLSLEEFNKNLKFIYMRTLFILVSCSLIGLLLSYFFARSLSHPISVLTETTMRVGKGDLSARAELSTDNELEILAHSFNSMTEALQKSQREIIVARDFTENIIKAMIDPLIIVNPDGTIRKVNRATLELLDYVRDEDIVGMKVEEVLADKELAKSDGLERLMRDGYVHDYDTEIIASSGERIPVIFSRSVMKEEDGTIAAFVDSAKDMRPVKSLINSLEKAREELARSYQELRDTQSQLIQSGKMSAIGQLAAGVAHELNNPLSGVLINAKLLQELMSGPRFKNVESMEEFSEYMDIILESTYRCRTIIENLLSFSRQSKERHTDTIDINEIIDKSLSLIATELRHSFISVKKNLGSDLPAIEGIFNKLQQVFINLLLNAYQFMPDGGEIEITTASCQEGKNIETRIRDTGPGIPGENLEKIFEPFFTTMSVAQGSGRGTGLGLAICYEIIKEHGGRIDVVSEVGKGATFIINLPVHEKAEEDQEDGSNHDAAAQDIGD
jgi:PAS domain S-box-containing protein